MPTFQIVFFIEPDDVGLDDIEIEQRVDAQDADEALTQGRQQLLDEHPDIDPTSSTSWFIMRTSP
jgi:hypothetical protein